MIRVIGTRTGVRFRSVEHDGKTGIHRFEYDTDATSASLAVVAALSEVMGTDPTEFGPLNDVIDTDALDDVIRFRDAAEGGVRATLSVEGYAVTVQSDGVVTVTAPGREAVVEPGGSPTHA